MADPLTDVFPGDLITASAFNQVIHDLVALEARVTDLEQGTGTVPGGPTIITGLSPVGPYRLGDDLHVLGSGFGLPSQAAVTIDGVRIGTFKPGSNDSELIFTIPNLQGVTSTGKVVTLTVSANGTASTSLAVFPYVPTIPTGLVSVTLSQPPAAGSLLAGQSYVFVYAVTASADLDEIYSLVPTVSAGWQATVVDNMDQPLVPAEIFIQNSPLPGKTLDVRVRVSIPGGTPNGTATLLRLTATSKRNPTQLHGASGGEAIVVGMAPPSGGTDIVLAYVPGSAKAPAGAPAPTETGGVVTIASYPSSYRLTFTAQIKDPGNYLAEIVDPGDSHWTVTLSGGATSSQLTTGAPNSTNVIYVFVRATAGAPQIDATLRVSSTTSLPITGQYAQAVRI